MDFYLIKIRRRVKKRGIFHPSRWIYEGEQKMCPSAWLHPASKSALWCGVQSRRGYNVTRNITLQQKFQLLGTCLFRKKWRTEGNMNAKLHCGAFLLTRVIWRNEGSWHNSECKSPFLFIYESKSGIFAKKCSHWGLNSQIFCQKMLTFRF